VARRRVGFRSVILTFVAAVVLGGCGSGTTTTVTVTKNNGGGNGASVSGGGGGAGAVSSAPHGQLQLVDSGFSQYSAFGSHGINYALLIKNTSTTDSFDQAEVVVSFENKQGTSVASDDTFADPIPPGKVGALVSEVTDVPAGAKVAKMVVEISPPLDWTQVPPGAITGKVVAVKASDSYGTYEVKTTALYRSTFTKQLKDVDADAVYRNAARHIIGGTSDIINIIPASGRANHVFDDFPNYQGIRHVEVYAAPTSITQYG
jgi:hypothetical protein